MFHLHSIFSMRDMYKNPAYAIAELLDNSIQAGANSVQLICAERTDDGTKTGIIQQIAIIDNGSGMSSELLLEALQVGRGANEKKDGIGKFGMGLPMASISQCQKVEIWSWIDGVSNDCYAFFDINEMIQNNQFELSTPVKKSIPKQWFQFIDLKSQSGTLVVWHKLDRMIWKRKSIFFEKIERIIGRIYRNFLNNGELEIKMLSLDIETNNLENIKLIKPNDPCYLMEKTSCPAPFDSQAMFTPYGVEAILEFDILGCSESHKVVIKFSHAKEEARVPLVSLHEIHARHNVGISIVRAGRELEMIKHFVNNESNECWWGVEIEFPPALDELMGVTNPKQHARNLSDLFETIETDIESLIPSGKTVSQVLMEMKQENNPIAQLFEIALIVKNKIREMRSLIRIQEKRKFNKF